ALVHLGQALVARRGRSHRAEHCGPPGAHTARDTRCPPDVAPEDDRPIRPGSAPRVPDPGVARSVPGSADAATGTPENWEVVDMAQTYRGTPNRRGLIIGLCV